MPKPRLLFPLLVAGAMLTACATPERHGSTSPGATSGVEEIYVLRSLQEESAAPDAFCDPAKTGFVARTQNRYVFKAVVTRPSDGRVVEARAHPAGTLRACFDGSIAVERNFYAEGVLAGVPATGRGKCTPVPLAEGIPETGIHSARCFLVLTGLPARYVAGVLATNSVISRTPTGDRSDPPGYTQPSIATVRLWLKR